MGIRAITRFTGFDLSTVLNILETAGQHCAAFLDAKVRNVKVPCVQIDEVYSYVQKQPDGTEETGPDSDRGDMWTFLSIAQFEKLIISWKVSKRTGEAAEDFLWDLKSRLACRIQLTTDSFRGYVAVSGSTGGVQNVFGNSCDYATEVKRFSKDTENFKGPLKYFAPKRVRVHREARFGNPDLSIATTNHAERTNLSLRTFTRRFVRRTINFSKKMENHAHAVAIFVAFFNYCRVHKSLNGKTPAMAAGLTDHVWTVKELLS